VWRYQLSNAIKSAAIGLGYSAIELSNRRYLAGIWRLRFATVLLRVAAWIEPNRNGPILRRTFARLSDGED
jgi:hypothetical protein